MGGLLTQLIAIVPGLGCLEWAMEALDSVLAPAVTAC